MTSGTAALALAAWLGAMPAPAPAETPAQSRVVAVGDVHGDLEAFRTIIEEAELIDRDGQWTGGEATLVQTGDILDRGPGVRAVMDLLMRLEAEAQAADGRVVVLLGNHEAMNLVRIVRDVAPEAFAAFANDDGGAGDDSEDGSDDGHPPGFRAYVEALGPDGHYGAWLRRLPTVAVAGETLFVHGGISPIYREHSVEELNAEVAEVFASFDRNVSRLVEAELVAPTATLDEIRTAVAAALHADEGSTSAEVDTRSPPSRNAPPGTDEVRSPLDPAALEAIARRLDELPDSIAFAGSGPLWYRGYARLPASAGREVVELVTEAHGVERIVCGHNPSRGEIRARFDDRVFLIDSGMNAEYVRGGRPAALEIEGDEVVAIYPGERVVLASAAAATPAPTEPPERWLGADGEPLPFSERWQILDFLENAEVAAVEEIPVGVTRPKKLTLELQGVRAHAVFRDVDVVEDVHRLADGTVVMFFRDSYTNELAAQEVAQLLGLATVPPVVERRLPRLGEGSVQLWIENAFTAADKRDEGREPPSLAHYNRQLQTMFLFDNLINNIDRNLGNILIDESWRVWYIDHTRAFSRHEDLPSPERLVNVERGVWERLRALDEDELRAAVDPYLSRFEIATLLERRERLVELVEERVCQHGSDTVFFRWGEPVGGEPPVVDPEVDLDDAT